MGGGNETSVTVVGLAGALSAVIFWLMGVGAPRLAMAATPTIVAAVTTIIVALLCWFLPSFHTPKPPASPGGST